jgi:hypothetical protein
MIKSRRMKWAGNVACMKDEEYVQRFGGTIRRTVTTRKTEIYVARYY